MKFFKKQCQNIDFCGETTENNQKSKGGKFKKRFAVGCLAVLMCGTALFGVACTPATSGAQGASPTSSADGGANSPAGINTSPFNLNPETDPVVYTTSSGLEIKCSNALTNTNLASYTYFTMGEYEGTPVNWVIIGYDPSVSSLVGEYTGDFNQGCLIQGDYTVNSTLDNSPMGTAILKEFFAISSEAKPNDEIGDGCVLCLSELILYKCQYATSIAQYPNSNLETQCNNIYSSLSEKDKKFVVQVTLKTTTGKEGSSVSQYEYTTKGIFALAGRDQSYENFHVFNYLTTTQATCGASWWLRSGAKGWACAAKLITSSGTLLGDVPNTNPSDGEISNTHGLRPAFVMKLI